MFRYCMVDDKRWLYPLTAQVGQRPNDLLNLLLGNTVGVTQVINPKDQNTPIGVIRHGHQVLGQSVFVGR